MRKFVLALAMMIMSANSFAWKCCIKDGGGDAPGVFISKNKCQDKGYAVSEGLSCPWRCSSQYFLVINNLDQPSTDEKYLGLTPQGDWTGARTNCKNMATNACGNYKNEAVKKVFPSGIVPVEKCSGTKLEGNTSVKRGSDEKKNPKEVKCNVSFSVSYRCDNGGSLVNGKCYSCPTGFSLQGTNCVKTQPATVGNAIADKCNY